MKFALVIASLCLAACSSGQTTKKETPQALTTSSSIPSEVITDDSTYWTVSTLSNMQYVNTTPGAYYNTMKSGGGMIVKFKFKPNGKYEFMLYVQVTTYNITTESWTHVEGNVEFTKNAKGQPIFKTIPVKGTYIYNKGNGSTTRAATKEELQKSQLRTYLWERWENPEDKKNDYLLVVDITSKPDIDLNQPGAVTPDMVSKFHIPKK